MGKLLITVPNPLISNLHVKHVLPMFLILGSNKISNSSIEDITPSSIILNREINIETAYNIKSHTGLFLPPDKINKKTYKGGEGSIRLKDLKPVVIYDIGKSSCSWKFY